MKLFNDLDLQFAQPYKMPDKLCYNQLFVIAWTFWSTFVNFSVINLRYSLRGFIFCYENSCKTNLQKQWTQLDVS